jgi:hypothetical protein
MMDFDKHDMNFLQSRLHTDISIRGDVVQVVEVRKAKQYDRIQCEANQAHTAIVDVTRK